jgi:hypothetical protein
MSDVSMCNHSSWWPVCLTACPVLNYGGKSLAGLKQIQAQTDDGSSNNTPYQMLNNSPVEKQD